MSNGVFLGFTLKRTMASSTYEFETLNVTKPSEFVYHVEINRPEKRNAMNMTFWRFKSAYLLLFVYDNFGAFEVIFWKIFVVLWCEVNFWIIVWVHVFAVD